MATTFVDYTGDGNATKSFSFPSIKEADIKVEVDEVIQTSGTHYNITSYTTTGGGNVVFIDNSGSGGTNHIPQSPARIRIFRDTDVDSAKATFTAGSSVKAGDLNNNNKQLLYSAQEEQNQTIQTHKIKDSAVTTAKIKDQNVTTAKIADDAVTGAKLPDDVINSEHYAAVSIDTEHIANENITTAKLANSAVTSSKLADANVITAKIADSNVTTAKIADSNVTTAKIADSNVTTVKIADSNVTTAKIADSNVTTAKIADDAVTSAKLANDIDLAGTLDVSGQATFDNNVLIAADNKVFTVANGSSVNKFQVDTDNGNTTIQGGLNVQGGLTVVGSTILANEQIGTSELATDAVTTAKITDSNVTTDKIADSNVTTAKIADDAVTAAKIADSVIVTNSEQASASVNDTSFFTTSASDARYFNISSGDTIKDGDTFPDNDTTIATTAAINDRIIDLVDDVGGFVPIASETNFPTANPDVNNGAGTLVSIKAIGSSRTPSSGTVTIANGAGSGNTVTITGCGSTVLAAGFGAIVETTSTLHTYAFHRLVPKATEVTTVAANATNIAAAGANTTNINAVANNASNINTVAGNNANVSTVAGISANVTTVAGIQANVTTVANNNSNVTAVAGNNSNITAVAGNATNINAVQANASNINTVAGINSDVTAVAGNSSNINSAVSNASNINSAVSNASNINSAVSNATNINTVAGAITNVNTTATNISNVNTVASNISNVNSFAGTYQIASSAPSTDGAGNALAEGDLYFDTSSDELRIYNGSSWQGGVTAGSGFATSGANTFTGNQIIQNTAPTLTFNDTTDNPDFRIRRNSNGLAIDDTTNSNATRLQINSDGHVDVTGNLDVGNGLDVTGNITVSGNVDGRDVAADGTKLDGIETGATADQTASEILSLLSDQNITTTGNITIGGTQPSLLLADSDNNPDYVVRNDNGVFKIRDYSNARDPIVINTDGHVDLNGNVDISSGLDVTGNITVTGTVDGVDIAALNTTVANITTDVVSDTSPQLGGVLHSNGHDIDFADGDKARFGNSQDLQIHHDGNNSYIKENGTGALVLSTNQLLVRNAAVNEFLIQAVENAGVKLYYDNSKKLETVTGGVTVTGTLTADGLGLGDSENISLGNGGDFQIRHDGANNWVDSVANHPLIVRAGTNDLYLQGSDVLIGNENASKKYIDAHEDAAVELYHNNAMKLATMADGVIVKDLANNTAQLRLDTAQGAGGSVYADTANSRFGLLTTDGEWAVRSIRNGTTELYYNNDKKIETTSSGVTVTGTLTATAFSGDGSSLTGVSAGKVKQIQKGTLNGSFGTGSSSYQATGCSVTITTTGGKVLIMAGGTVNNTSAGSGAFTTIYRDSTNISDHGTHMAGYWQEDNSNNVEQSQFLHTVDSPSAGTYTYQVYIYAHNGSGTAYWGYRNTGVITAMEIES